MESKRRYGIVRGLLRGYNEPDSSQRPMQAHMPDSSEPKRAPFNHNYEVKLTAWYASLSTVAFCQLKLPVDEDERRIYEVESLRRFGSQGPPKRNVGQTRGPVPRELVSTALLRKLGVVSWVAVVCMWLFIASLPPGNSEAAKSPYHKVCAVCSKAAAGTQTYSDPHVPGSEEDVYLCDYHLAHPPATNPKGETQGDPSRGMVIV